MTETAGEAAMVGGDAQRLIQKVRIASGEGFRLADFDPADRLDLDPGKHALREMVAGGVAALSLLQERLYAQRQWSLLVIFQAMDAGGKDSAIKHVMSGVNPQGCQVHSFRAPSDEELDHDFLWRCMARLPERGRIGIFNRSYYEEVLIARVHPELLARQRLPDALVTDRIWEERYESIRAAEAHLARNGTAIVKIFLNVSKAEQRKRFMKRLDDPEKHWKFEASDIAERAHWDAYMTAYEDAIGATAAPHAPWFVVPADHKWVSRVAVVAALIDALHRLDLRFPAVSPAREERLAEARRALKREKTAA